MNIESSFNRVPSVIRFNYALAVELQDVGQLRSTIPLIFYDEYHVILGIGLAKRSASN